MTSNEHDAIEQNVEHHETNNSIYYTREMELCTVSYDMLNRGTYRQNKRHEKYGPREKVNLVEQIEIWPGLSYWLAGGG